MSNDVDERGHCSKCGGTHYGTGRTCVFDQTFTPTPPWPKPKHESANAMMHASAPLGHKCADCTIDGKACSDCLIAGLTKERDALRADLQRAQERDQGIWGHAMTCGYCQLTPCDHQGLWDDLARLERQVNASVPKEVYAAQAETVTQLRADLAALQEREHTLVEDVRKTIAERERAYTDCIQLRADLRACVEALDRILPAMVTVSRWIKDHESDLPGLEDDIHNLADAVDQARAALSRPGVQAEMGK